MMVVTPRHRGFFLTPGSSFPYLQAAEVEVERYEYGDGKLGIDFEISIVYTYNTLKRRSLHD
tara:strand:- start:136 stop:321 length:186 start_codon:yes stop_codon:yes gene_type:complete